MKKFTSFFLILTLASCFSYKPILDQNEKFFQTQRAEREADVNKCNAEADNYLKEFKARRAAKEAARKALIGSVVGAASGIILGHDLSAFATGAVIGAGVGAAVGGLSVAGEDKVTPDQIKQRYIANCLGRKGYQIIGWE